MDYPRPTKPRPKTRYSLRIDDALLDALKNEALKHGVTLTTVIETLLLRGLEQSKNAKKEE